MVCYKSAKSALRPLSVACWCCRAVGEGCYLAKFILLRPPQEHDPSSTLGLNPLDNRSRGNVLDISNLTVFLLDTHQHAVLYLTQQSFEAQKQVLSQPRPHSPTTGNLFCDDAETTFSRPQIPIIPAQLFIYDNCPSVVFSARGASSPYRRLFYLLILGRGLVPLPVSNTLSLSQQYVECT